MYTRGIRGATTINANTEEEIKEGTIELVNEIMRANSIKKEDISFAIFTVTSDIDAAFPAKFVREELGFDYVPMMCYREMEVKGALSMCIRALVTINTEKTQKEIKHCYLKNASILRKDLQK